MNFFGPASAPHGRRLLSVRLAAMLAALVCAWAMLEAPAMAADEPAHTTEVREGAFEVRVYEPMVVAETIASGPRGRAANTAFGPLFRFIDGGNADRQKIAMTAPVTQEPATGDGRSWRVRFVMPAGYEQEGTPAPTNPDVNLHRLPAQRVAIMRFSGFATEEALARNEQRLRAEIAARGLAPAPGAVVTYAFYDPPFAPPFLRRNEVMIALASSP